MMRLLRYAALMPPYCRHYVFASFMLAFSRCAAAAMLPFSLIRVAAFSRLCLLLMPCCRAVADAAAHELAICYMLLSLICATITLTLLMLLIAMMPLHADYAIFARCYMLADAASALCYALMSCRFERLMPLLLSRLLVTYFDYGCRATPLRCHAA